MFNNPKSALIYLIERCKTSSAPLSEAERTIAIINEASEVIQLTIQQAEQAARAAKPEVVPPPET